MNTLIENEEQLYTMMRKQIVEPLIKQVSKKIADRLTEYIQTKWYDANGITPFYDRTYDFIDAVTTSDMSYKNGKMSINIYIDADKMRQFAPTYNKDGSLNRLGSRVSLGQDKNGYNKIEYEGISISKWLIQWIEEGQKSSFLPHKGIHMFKNVSNEMENKLNGIISEILREMGISFKKGV